MSSEFVADAPVFGAFDLERFTRRSYPFDEQAWQTAHQIVKSVQREGEVALKQYARQFDEWTDGQPLILGQVELDAALAQLSAAGREVLQRTADRIREFARAQLATLNDCDVAIPGGRAGHRWFPLQSAGCYAPGGRYPLPSSVLMTAVTARVAGVEQVWVASPRPSLETRAAAAIAQADGLLCVGGAQAIAALAYAVPSPVPACDVIVGPGNRYVTAAKSVVARTTRIDMLAGPSELVVVATTDANPAWVAADLLAQAEHDTDARPVLVTTCKNLATAVIRELSKQLASLPTAQVAQVALQHGGYLVAESLDQAAEFCRQISPEHLSLQGTEVEAAADQFRQAGALFIGGYSPEACGDYGAGPNHVLPTGGTARSQSGLWVGSFMRFQTFLQLNSPQSSSSVEVFSDSADLARMEGLEAHARSAEIRNATTD